MVTVAMLVFAPLLVVIVLIIVGRDAENARERGRGSTLAFARAATPRGGAELRAWPAAHQDMTGSDTSAAAAGRHWIDAMAQRAVWSRWSLCGRSPARTSNLLAKLGSGPRRGFTCRAKGSLAMASTSLTATRDMDRMPGVIINGDICMAASATRPVPPAPRQFEGGARRLGAGRGGLCAAEDSWRDPAPAAKPSLLGARARWR